MSNQREEILRVCAQHLRDRVAVSGALEHDLSIFFDELAQALRCQHGLHATAPQQQIGERFGYLAHELRRALSNAALAFKLMERDMEPRGRTASVLANNLVRMEALIARTFGQAQLDSGMPLELRPLRVASVLRQLQASFIPERAISGTLEVDDSLHVNGDEVLLTALRQGGPDYVVRCLLPASPELATSGDCQRDIRVGRDLSVLYRFSSRHLAEWEHIDAAIAQFVETRLVNRSATSR